MSDAEVLALVFGLVVVIIGLIGELCCKDGRP